MKTFPFVAILLIALTEPKALRAETYNFVPSRYHNTFSGAHAPILTIKSGDRVSTTTVDDTGVDAGGKNVATGPNPQTGPFYIDGAEPGDLIVVSIDKLTPTRSTGYSTSLMATRAIGAGALEGRPDDTRFPWAIDVARGLVRFDLKALAPNVDWTQRFASPFFELPLAPMLASIAVAPANDAAPSTASGPFGGNVAVAALAAGAHVMLPVYQRGALLFIGHGHARQSDGVISTTGIETPMAVDFSVEVVKRRHWPHSSIARRSTTAGEFELQWPRVETGEYLMTIGSGPIEQALQHATLELHHWLDDDYGLSEKSTSLLIGQAIEYEIGTIVDQQATVVAKVRKSYLPRPAGPLEAPPEEGLATAPGRGRR